MTTIHVDLGYGTETTVTVTTTGTLRDATLDQIVATLRGLLALHPGAKLSMNCRGMGKSVMAAAMDAHGLSFEK